VQGKCPNFGEVVQVSAEPSPEVKAAAEKDMKMQKLQKEIEAAGKAGDMNKVMALSKKLKEIIAQS